MKRLIISNSCTGETMDRGRAGPYLTPFIATLVPSDLAFMRICANLESNLEQVGASVCDLYPKKSEWSALTGRLYYEHPKIPKKYPVLHLPDGDIHLIHEHSCVEAKKKFLRRSKRALTELRGGKRPHFVWSYAEMFSTPFGKRRERCLEFLRSPNCYMVGPALDGLTGLRRYGTCKEWNQKPSRLDATCVTCWNNQHAAAAAINRLLSRCVKE